MEIDLLALQVKAEAVRHWEPELFEHAPTNLAAEEELAWEREQAVRHGIREALKGNVKPFDQVKRELDIEEAGDA